MAHVNRSFRRSSPSSRRKSTWSQGPGGTTLTVITGSSSTILGAGSIALEPITLVRTRGELLMYLESAVTARDGFLGAFGIGIASHQAFLAGAAALPAPITEMDWDGWLYHRIINVQAAGPIVVATASQIQLQVHDTTAALRVEVDSKAMRKLGPEMVQFAMLEVVEVGAANMVVEFNSRVLDKLS